MKRLPLPGTDLALSQLGLGACYYGTRVDEPAAFALLDRFVAAGGNFVDTASLYGQWGAEGINASERLLGRWMRARRNRDRLVVFTKGCGPVWTDRDSLRVTPEALAADLEGSLAAFGVDHIDLYLLHRDDPRRPVGEILEALQDHVSVGKIRHFGCSNWSAERMRAAQAWCRERGRPGFVANSPQWNLAEPNRDFNRREGTLAMDEAMFAFHRETGLPALPYSPQALGLFTKALRPDFDADPRNRGVKDRFVNPVTLRRVERVRHLAAELEVDGTDLALAWLLHQPFVTLPIIGPRIVGQLDATVAALELRLTPAQVAWLEAP